MEKQFKITKSTVEQYKIRHESGMYYADIVLDHNGEKGRIQIASDYGSWQNYWGSCGCSFKEFLTRIDMWYFAGKVGENNWLDFEATKNKMYQDIKEARMCRQIDAEEAKEICMEAKHVFDSANSKSAYEHLIYNSEKIWKLYQDPSSIPVETGISPQFKRFFNEAWAAFIEEIKKEI